ncbi:hypothetical protein [Massilia sp. AB1]|uniref:hypothetical protein n=1 Tax=Massilia sp. AB1 TaxID=2823371 RepID=UPI001B82966C|nr:hypothetical protein [Massilia sp. AB1]MBQ5942389.1 hypothetical protein [Massilia sp. AB1]
MSSIPSIVPLLPAVTPSLQVGAVAAAAPVALTAFESGDLPLPVAQVLSPAPAAPPAADAGPDGAAMRPDQVFMARQLHFTQADGPALAASWRAMVRNYGAQLMNRELRAHAGQLPPAVLVANQEGRVLRQADSGQLPADAWRFTVHAGGPRDQHLRVIQEGADAPPGRRRRARAALRLELELADGMAVVLQVEPMPGGVALELCAPDAPALARLRELQPMLEQAVARAGLTVLRWTYRDRLPAGPVHARMASGDAGQVLTLPVFRAAAELALVLPMQGEAAVEENFTQLPLMK